MPTAGFVKRSELAEFEWDNKKKNWDRPELDRDILKELSQRSTLNGLLRMGYFVVLLASSAVGTVLLARIHLALAIPALYVYYFFYGFWVAIAHELQHQTAFAKSANWLSEIVFFFVQALMWNSPRFARVSHKLHHRYTMVKGMDPETEFPEVVTTEWLRNFVRNLIAKVLVIGAIVDLGRNVVTQIRRISGRKNWMMENHCTEKDLLAIRLESAGILLFHLAIVAAAIVFRRWELLVFVTIAWQIGTPIEQIWHMTKHVGRPYNVKDHRLNTRSVRVSWFIKTIFWGLDDHVDHHLYPAVPSRNLSKLHAILKDRLPEPSNALGCWTEMFAIAQEKDRHPETEFLAVGEKDTSRTAGGHG